MGSLCVFCGSRPGALPVYEQAARRLGEVLARQGITLVYGGARVGLMGALADAALQHGGKVIGVLPSFLSSKEVAHPGITELHLVSSMHERKAMMAERASGFIALPGGIGTFEELLEVLSWTQLGLHQKPCGVLNVEGYYDSLLGLIERAARDRFIFPEHRALLCADSDPERLLEKLRSFQPPETQQWLRPSET